MTIQKTMGIIVVDSYTGLNRVRRDKALRCINSSEVEVMGRFRGAPQTRRRHTKVVESFTASTLHHIHRLRLTTEPRADTVQ